MKDVHWQKPLLNMQTTTAQRYQALRQYGLRLKLSKTWYLIVKLSAVVIYCCAVHSYSYPHSYSHLLQASSLIPYHAISYNTMCTFKEFSSVRG